MTNEELEAIDRSPSPSDNDIAALVAEVRKAWAERDEAIADLVANGPPDRGALKHVIAERDALREVVSSCEAWLSMEESFERANNAEMTKEESVIIQLRAECHDALAAHPAPAKSDTVQVPREFLQRLWVAFNDSDPGWHAELRALLEATP